MTDNNATTVTKTRKDRSHYFDRFIMAGLLMNVLIVALLLGFWLVHTFFN